MNLKIGIRKLVAVAVLATPFVVSGCEDDITQAEVEETLLLSIAPQGGAMDVDPNGPIVIDFSHPMMEGMEQYADVHEGHVEGPLVPGSWSWNEGRTKLTFTPDSPLKPLTQYVVHLGGGMQDQTGHHINYEEHGLGTGNGGMGGQWMTQEMHQGGNHGYGNGMGGMGMGTNWSHPTNGGYGMTFTFTTS
jgi:hypothetical protein